MREKLADIWDWLNKDGMGTERAIRLVALAIVAMACCVLAVQSC